MCLYATSQKALGDKAPTRKIAYKVVEKRTREPIFFTGQRYWNGSIHTVSRKDVMNACNTGREYHVGYHVYTRFDAAAGQWSPGRTIIAVAVTPARWVADGNGGTCRPNEAVYTGLRVIGRVTKEQP